MTEKTYDWKRYWFPRGAKASLGPGGYLINPESDLGRIANSELVTLDSLDDVPCLVLLGEPGMGKTNALESLIRLKANSWMDEGAVIANYDLRSYGSEDRLVRDLFESRQFEEWLQAESLLVLTLDSLDECLLRIDTVAALLVDELRKRSIPVVRLRLRITCRPAVWPEMLEKGLNSIWGEEAVSIIEMAPLTLEDIAVAAQTNGIDPALFIDALHERGALPLATKPVSLELLIRIFLASGELPTTTIELYERGLRKLCEETSESRKASRRIGNLDADQRLVVAARIAAMTTLAGKEAIWMGLDDGEHHESDIPYVDLSGGTEGIGSSCFSVDEVAVRETLDTSLFVASGPNCLSFFHATYAEFLTAKYLTQHELKTPQVLSLLTYSGVVGDRLAPQQHGTAAWLAAMRTDVFRALANTDPSVLLRSDVSTATDSDRHELVNNLLWLYNEESLLPPRIGSRHQYTKLQHPGLADQIIDCICDKSKTSLARCEALEIAKFCKLEACQESALDIFLDSSEEEPVRRTAGYVLLAVADDATKLRMKPLVYGDHPEDVNDELKGIALKALWPNFMTSPEVFSLITAPKRDNFFGSYREFLHELCVTLAASDMPEALSWLARQPSRQSLSYAFRDLMDGIMIAAWDNLNYPPVVTALANASLRRLELGDSLVEGFQERKSWIQMVGDQCNRRSVLEILIHLLSGSTVQVAGLAWSQTPLVLSEDFWWLIDRMDEHEDDEKKRVMAKLIRMVFNRQDHTQVDQILSLVRHNRALGEEFSWLWWPVALDSPEADKMRADYAKQNDFEKVVAEQERSEQEAFERLLQLLDECEAGQPWLFSTITEELLLRPRLAVDHRLLEADLTRLPGWERSDGAVRQRILQAAKRYLTEHRAKPQEWFGTNKYDSGVFAGYKSFRLIFAEEKEYLTTIPAEVWKEWAPVILAYPTRLGFGDEKIFMELVSVAFFIVPHTISNALTILLDKENRENGTIMVTRKVRYCRGPEVERTLLAMLRDDAFTVNSTEVVLDELFARKVSQAKDYAEDLVKNASHLQGILRQKSMIAASLLVFHTRADGWKVVWPVILTDDDFGLNIIPKIAARDRINDSQMFKTLSEDDLGGLFEWLTKHYPHHEDPKYDSVHAVEIREEIADWRNSLLLEVRDRGTREAIDALRHIQDEFPDLSWLKWTLAEAYEIHRKNSWVPPEPRQILEMALDNRKRLVRSERELLEAVSESLRSLEKELQGETPAAIFLWDHIQDDKYKPKRETDFSDYIKLHLDKELRDRGVIVNREVQIHRGERTDVYVNAISRTPCDGIYDSVNVIIEVKGCWHGELWKAMETQLVGQYMTNNTCKAGIYVVGWFNCVHWCVEDQQTKKLTKELLAMDISEAQKQLDDQANVLSSGGRFLRTMVLDTGLHKA